MRVTHALAVSAMLTLFAFTSHARQPTRAALVARLDSIAAAPVKDGRVAGMSVAVIRGSDTLLHKGYGLADLENDVPATPQTVFRIGSITKQFTSSAVMRLAEQGQIGLDDDITKYLPGYPEHGRHILVRHLLNHTSGIPSYTDIGPSFGRIARLDLPHDSLIATVDGDSLMFEPGSHFYYNNTGYFLLGMILEKVTGRKYGDYLRSALFAPLGLTHTVYCSTAPLIPHRAQGYTRAQSAFTNADYISMELPFAAGSLCSTVDDLVKWTRALHAGRVVSAASFRDMTTPVKLPSGRPMSYGYGLEIGSLGGHREISHGGGINGFISQLAEFPDDSLTVVVLANTAPAPSSEVATALAAAVLGVAVPGRPVPKDVATTPEDRARYVGEYALTMPDGRRERTRVYEEAGKLMIESGGQKPAALSYQGDGVFVAGAGMRVAFDVRDGKTVGFQFGGGSRTLEAVRIP